MFLGVFADASFHKVSELHIPRRRTKYSVPENVVKSVCLPNGAVYTTAPSDTMMKCGVVLPASFVHVKKVK